jgi:RNA polymerase sigma-70 factor (ECF subfamily)
MAVETSASQSGDGGPKRDGPSPSRAAKDRTERNALIDSLYRTYHARLLRHFWRLHHHRDELEDLAAEVFARLCACDMAPLRERPGAMVFRVANFVSADSYKAKGRLKRNGQKDFDCDIPHDLPDRAPDQEQRLAWRQDIRLALDIANTLPPKGAQAFILFRFHGLSTLEIAARQGVAVKTIENHIAASTQKFQSAYQAAA